MGVAAGDASTVERWSPVCRGFTVSFPNSERGHAAEIRLRDGGVEPLVASVPSPLPIAAGGPQVATILRPTQRISIRASSVSGRDDAAGVDGAGGIVRMLVRHSSRIAEAQEEAA